jgi:hypothetical protein
LGAIRHSDFWNANGLGQLEIDSGAKKAILTFYRSASADKRTVTYEL